MTNKAELLAAYQAAQAACDAGKTDPTKTRAERIALFNALMHAKGAFQNTLRVGTPRH